MEMYTQFKGAVKILSERVVSNKDTIYKNKAFPAVWNTLFFCVNRELFPELKLFGKQLFQEPLGKLAVVDSLHGIFGTDGIMCICVRDKQCGIA